MKLPPLFAILLLACQTLPPPTPVVVAKPEIPTRQLALGRDPEAMDEAVRQALTDFRDKFACNEISGCPAMKVLHNYGFAARPLLQQLFEAASRQSAYRGRTVRAIAELKDPQSRDFLLHTLSDRDADTRAYAIYGLGLLGAIEASPRLRAIALEDPPIWRLTPKLSALWSLAMLGDQESARLFQLLLEQSADQHMAGMALTWGAELCLVAPEDVMDCGLALAKIGHHPSFTARRAAAKAMARLPRPAQIPTLIELTGDPVHSITDPAQDALWRLTGRRDLEGHAAWMAWLKEQGK